MAAENVYLLKVGKNASAGVQKRLALGAGPSHVRVATLAPLSNYGYPPGAEGAVLEVNDHGLVFGAEEEGTVSCAFVPWQNVSYVADGTALAKK